MSGAAEFHYRVAGRVASPVPGAHAGRFDGDGSLIRGLDPLGQGADPRRIDLRASSRDPLERLLVRRYRQPGSLTLAALVDVSASMRLGQPARSDAETPLATAARFVASAAYSAHRSGDRFACYAANDAPVSAVATPPTKARGAGQRAADALRALGRGPMAGRTTRHGRDATGMPALAALLPARRCLVFVLSDFHWPGDLLRRTVAALSVHDVVPVVLDAADPLQGLPTRGLSRITDVETGAERTVWMRPALRAAIERADAQRRARLDAALDAFGLRPLRLAPDFGGDDVTRYFIQ